MEEKSWLEKLVAFCESNQKEAYKKVSRLTSEDDKFGHSVSYDSYFISLVYVVLLCVIALVF